MNYLTIALFALAVSADGFAVGIAYGIAKIRIPVFSLLVISLASALAVSLSMLCGKGLAELLSPQMSSYVGAIIILALGVYFLLQAGKNKINSLENDQEKPLLAFSIKPLGIIVQILKQPSRADFDCSGEISTTEAFFLGLALAMDALGAGIGIAMTGSNILYTAVCVGMLKFILVNSGIFLGSKINAVELKAVTALVPGLVFVAIGIIELMRK
ncbi:MAG TPA: sporulation membrane protein YtaF [Gelria sp.]|jgi:putative sporulation protein YtaF|nr:sporulation membrane protein YtaF [Gelria sp.]